MIAEHQEPKGLSPNATGLACEGMERARKRKAARGSQMLRDAILRANGVTPPRRRRVRPVPPRHAPECCSHCGAPTKPGQIMIARIQAVVAAYYGIKEQYMRSAQRGWDIAHPRQTAMFLASELTPKSLPDIGRRFGGRDHTTVIHAIKAVRHRIATDPEIAADVETLRERLTA